MSDHAEHPYTGYNKFGTSDVLVGNWQEERALADATGTSRYEKWVKDDGMSTTVYATKQDSSADIPTKPRVIEHSNQLYSEEWITHTKLAYQDPKARNNTLMTYMSDNTLGPREKMELARLMEASKVTTIQEPQRSFETTHRTHYTWKDPDMASVGALAMQDLDGRPAVRDPTFLAEANIMNKSSADRMIPQPGDLPATMRTAQLPDPNVPVTVYSEAVAKGAYGAAVYGSKPAVPSRPFGKQTDFSKPMTAYNKVVENE